MQPSRRGRGASRVCAGYIREPLARLRPDRPSRFSRRTNMRRLSWVAATAASGASVAPSSAPRADDCSATSVRGLLPFGDDAGGYGVANHVGGAAAHAEELVDAQDSD